MVGVEEESMGLVSAYGDYTARMLRRYRSDIEVYRAALVSRVESGARLLHFGCGWDRSAVTSVLRDRAQIVGIDLDPTTAGRYHSRFFCGDGARLPFTDESFDIVCSEYVFEHIADPYSVVSEISRVLRPGGRLVALTPNRLSYKSLFAAATPLSFHRLAAGRLRPDKRDAADVYPTQYRMNTRAALARLAAASGLELSSVVYLNNGPTWFRRMPGVFELGHLYHRLLEARELERLRCGLLLEMKKEGASQTSSASTTVRCIACGNSPMIEESRGLVCERCRNTYQRLAEDSFDCRARHEPIAHT